MKFLRPNKGVLEVSSAAHAVMDRYRQHNLQAPETGGILLGRLILDTENVVIDEVTQPTSHDIQGRFFFERAKQSAQQRVDDAWIATTGTRIYLGEWHTHPEDDPSPSSHDLENWRHIVQHAYYKQEYLLFVILGRQRTRAWEVDKEQLYIAELQSLDEEHHLSPPTGMEH